MSDHHLATVTAVLRIRRSLALLAAAAVAALLLTAVGAGSAVAAPGTWLSRINSYRVANGRSRLTEDYQASRVAQRWTQKMAATGSWPTTPSTGRR